MQVEKKKKLFCRLSTVAGADPDANISPPRAPKARNTHGCHGCPSNIITAHLCVLQFLQQ